LKHPHTTGYTVHTKELTEEAHVWDKQSGKLKSIMSEADGLRMDRIEAGVFQLLVTAYGPLIEHVMDRCREGQQHTEEIAKALGEVANKYSEAEKDGDELFKEKF
jgi:hypothetical protein